MNNIFATTAGVEELAVFSLISSLESFSIVFLTDLAQATTSFVSVFTREMDMVSLRQIEKQAYGLGLAIILPLTLGFFGFPEEVCRFFGLEAEGQLDIGAEAVWIFSFSLPPTLCCFLMFFYYQAAGFTKLSNVMIFCRSFLFILVPAWLLAPLYGIEGICFVCPWKKCFYVFWLTASLKIRMKP